MKGVGVYKASFHWDSANLPSGWTENGGREGNWGGNRIRKTNWPETWVKRNATAKFTEVDLKGFQGKIGGETWRRGRNSIQNSEMKGGNKVVAQAQTKFSIFQDALISASEWGHRCKAEGVRYHWGTNTERISR